MTEKQAKTIETWEDPPPERPMRYDWAAIAKMLRRRPGKWARIFEQDKASLVVALRSGNIAALRPDDGFEFRTSNNTKDKPRMCTLYARYVPEQEASN